jgi:uncharacterized repeat protein (TIGR03803 family)
MMKLNQRVWALGLCVLASTLAMSASAQTYTELLSFDGNTAAGPKTPMTQGIDGSLYGTTYYGGTGTCFDNQGIGCGIVFKITRDHEFKIVYNFQEKGGVYYPANNLVVGDEGNLYGTTLAGAGTIFKVTPGGTLTTLHSFGPGGSNPQGGIVKGADGNFYGTTFYGGASSNFCPSGCGTVFKMTPAGSLTTIYSFCPQNYCPDGENPQGILAQGIDGSFYGTTIYGGLYKLGTFFKITPKGTFTLLYAFSGFDLFPGGVLLASDGNFYGTSQTSVFRLTPEGAFTILSGTGNGNNPNLLTEGTDGNLYGTLQFGGDGSAFQMPLDGRLSTLYNFAGYPNDGSFPIGSLLQATDGKFYGVTYTGGDAPCNYGSFPGCGTIFSLNMGLDPFVAFLNRAGKVGQNFGILGQGFTGTTSVSLNGTPATFTVKSDTYLVATVPAGAKTGYVTVTTPGGALTSNVPFYVIR